MRLRTRLPLLTYLLKFPNISSENALNQPKPFPSVHRNLSQSRYS